MPNEKEFVFVRFLKGYARYSIMAHIDVELKKDSIYFLPYDCVRYNNNNYFFTFKIIEYLSKKVKLN